MNNQGWISIHRQLLDWEWYTDANASRLFIHILLKANHTDGKWRGIDVSRGSFITGRKALAKELGLSEQQIRTSLNKLISTSEVTIKTHNKFSIISITNWNDYQPINQQANQQVTNNQPTSNQQVTTNNNNNNNNNEKKKGKKPPFAPPSIAEVSEYSLAKKLNLSGFRDYYESNGWMVGRNRMKDWKASARNWSKRGFEGQQKQAGYGSPRYDC